jgi:hypothetical protein
MSQYAAKTEVSSERSRQEIERTLSRWGATQFLYGWDAEVALVGFRVRNRQVQFRVPMPDRDSKEFQYTSHSYPRRRTAAQATVAYEQAVKQRWRALSLVIKAKLEAVESGITDFDSEFLAQLVLPNGQTVGEYTVPKVAEAYALNEMPASMLPGMPRQAALES